MPAFVFRWLKATAALPYIRSGENPNIRLQDDWKRRWFCRACENQIGRSERAFAERLFPLVEAEAPAPYPHGPWLSRFVAAVALRALMFFGESETSLAVLAGGQKALVPGRSSSLAARGAATSTS